MTAADWIDNLARLAEAATPGPWVADHSEEDNSAVKQEGRAWWDGLAFCGRPADAEFIAAANPTTILRLIGEVHRWKSAWEMASPLLTERDALAAKVAAVEALADRWNDLPCVCGYVVPNGNDDRTQCLSCASIDLRAALSAAPADTTKET